MSRPVGILPKIAIPVGILLLSYGLVLLGANRLSVKLTLAEQVVSTLALFVGGIAIEILVILTNLSAQRDSTLRLWEIHERGEQRLGNLRALYARLVQKKYSDSDLFIDYFLRTFEELEHAIRDSVEKDELPVRSHHFESADSVLSAFSGESHPIHRYTWNLERGERLFPDGASTRYFELVEQMVRNKQIREVHALLVAESIDVLVDTRVAKLLDFYRTNRCFACRIVLSDTYEKLRADSEIPNDYVDFGIYGTRLMFLTKTYEPETIGLFVKDVRRVARYSDFFTRLWNSHASRKNPSAARTKVSFTDLVAFDQRPE